MSGKEDQPPAYTQPAAPQPAYQQQPPQPPYNTYPGADPNAGAAQGYYAQNPQMAYGQQPPAGYYYGQQQPPTGYYAQPGGPYPPQGYYPQQQQQQKSGPVSSTSLGRFLCFTLNLTSTTRHSVRETTRRTDKLTGYICFKQGFLEGCLAAMACCCCLDILF